MKFLALYINFQPFIRMIYKKTSLIVVIPKENDPLEHRVPTTPGSVKDLIKSGMKVQV